MDTMVLHKGEVFERVFVNEEVNLRIDQEAGSHVKIHVINAPFSIAVNQLEEGCKTEIYGLEHLHGEEKVIAETHVTHAVGGGTSNQLIKFVLDDHARGHFIGDLKIAPEAQQVEAHQTNRNLLLSENAEMRTQPQLEIYADDVQATTSNVRMAPPPVSSTRMRSSTCSSAVSANKKRANCWSARLCERS